MISRALKRIISRRDWRIAIAWFNIQNVLILKYLDVGWGLIRLAPRLAINQLGLDAGNSRLVGEAALEN